MDDLAVSAPPAEVTDLATLTAILYGARYQRRLPETDAQRRQAIAEALEDAKLILAAVLAGVATPKQPPPSPGIIGRKAVAKAPRRRGSNGRWTATGS
jgi:hypothetical protein